MIITIINDEYVRRSRPSSASVPHLSVSPLVAVSTKHKQRHINQHSLSFTYLYTAWFQSHGLCLTISRQLIRFPIITQHSKGLHYFHRVVGL